jgi:hypothetical protein
VTRHPSESALALFAGGELGRFGKWRVERHIEGCANCRNEVSQFSALRAQVMSADQMPDIEWNRLAAEMRANVRLGLEAGACVEKVPVARELFRPRVLAACASLALLVAAILLERPAPSAVAVGKRTPAILEASGIGIQVNEGDQSLMLLNTRARGISYSATGGAMRARYVDADTGYVTINNVYVQ